MSATRTVVSVSLGSPSRDHHVDVRMLGTNVSIRRQGTGGDFEAFLRAFHELDGTVDAFGVGGAEFYFQVGARRYEFHQLRKVRAAIVRSKVGDGNGIKHVLEPMAVAMLADHGVDLRGRKAVVLSAVDRYSLARAIVDAGCETTFGDFGNIGVPLPLTGLGQIRFFSAIVLPALIRMPFSVIYPVGDDEKPVPGVFKRHCAEADVIAADFLQIQANLPEDLTGKIIITNTTTERDVSDLKRRGLHYLVTTTPRLEGRSFGTNVMEAVCRALLDKPDAEITQEDLVDVMARIPIRPQIHVLTQ